MRSEVVCLLLALCSCACDKNHLDSSVGDEVGHGDGGVFVTPDAFNIDPEPLADDEVCNGIDDDEDGKIDENTTSDHDIIDISTRHVAGMELLKIRYGACGSEFGSRVFEGRICYNFNEETASWCEIAFGDIIITDEPADKLVVAMGSITCGGGLGSLGEGCVFPKLEYVFGELRMYDGRAVLPNLGYINGDLIVLLFQNRDLIASKLKTIMGKIFITETRHLEYGNATSVFPLLKSVESVELFYNRDSYFDAPELPNDTETKINLWNGDPQYIRIGDSVLYK